MDELVLFCNIKSRKKQKLGKVLVFSILLLTFLLLANIFVCWGNSDLATRVVRQRRLSINVELRKGTTDRVIYYGWFRALRLSLGWASVVHGCSRVHKGLHSNLESNPLTLQRVPCLNFIYMHMLPCGTLRSGRLLAEQKNQEIRILYF